MRRLMLTVLATTVAVLPSRADDWPQWLGPKRDSVWRETGLLDRFPSGGPKVLWRVPIDGGFSGPAVVGNRVFVMDYVASEGQRWEPGPGKRDRLKGRERVLCLDAGTGKLLWKHEYECPYFVSYASGPRCTPTVADGRVYTLGTMGDLHCLDAVDGRVVWAKDLKKGR